MANTRRPDDPRAPTGMIYALAAMAACLPGIANGIRMNPDLAAGTLLDPDSAMRLVRLNDIVAAGRPLHAVMRDGSGAGNLLPWSHLIDSLLLLLAAPIAPLAGWHTALHLAALAFGPLGMAALGIAIAWAAAPVADRNWLWLGAFAAAVAPVLGGYGMLGVVHHHILLVIVPVAMAGWIIRILHPAANPANDTKAAIALGAWAAIGLWLSPESVPFSLLALGTLWATWFATPSGTAQATRLARILLLAHATFAALTLLALAADPPAPGWTAIEPDRISLPFLLLAIGATLAAAAAHRTAERLPTLLVGIALAATFLLAFPSFLDGTAGLMSPEDAQLFFKGIVEMEPLDSLDDAARLLLGGTFAIIALLAFARTARTGLKLPLLYAAAGIAGSIALAALHVRFVVYPAAAGAVLLPIVLAAIARAAIAPGLQAVARTATVATLVAAPLLVPTQAAATPASHAPAAACRIPDAAALLAPFAGLVVLTSVNDVPDLLYATDILTVGSLYHRNPQGAIRLRTAWADRSLGSPSAALRDTAATLVLACRDAQAAGPLPRDATLAARLAAGRPPAWLLRIGTAGHYDLYAIAP